MLFIRNHHNRPGIIERRQSPSVDLSWYRKAIEPSTTPLKPADLAPVITGINNMLKVGYFEELDMLLKSFKVKQAAPEMMVTMLRMTYPARSNPLRQWSRLLREVRTELQIRQLDTSKILNGLI